MNPREKLAALMSEGAKLRQKSITGGEFTEKDASRAVELAAEVTGLQATIAKQDKASRDLQAAMDGTELQSNDQHKDWGGSGRTAALKAGTRYGVAEKARHFSDGVMRAFDAAAPLIGGPAVAKQLIPQGAITAEFDGRIIEDPRQRFSLAAALGTRQVNGAGGQYLRQTERDNQAATVAGGTLKPISRFGLSPASWSIATIAALTEPVRLQWLADYDGLQQFLTSELAYGVDEAAAEFILHGGTDENGDTVTGLLNTSGVQQTPYAVSALRTIRAAIGDLEAIGVEPTHIVMAPKDFEELEVSLDADQNFQFAGAPVDRVNQRLWGLPVVTPANMPRGEAVVGDLSTVTLLHRASHQLTWDASTANVGTAEAPEVRDLFRTNEVRFRDELRLGLEISSLKTYTVATLTTA